VQYFHVVFTLPDAFNALALANQRVVYGALFQAASRTLLEVAADPKHLGARIGFLAILHTWGQNLSLHPHLHCVIPGGGISPDGTRWVACRPGFFLPVRVLSRVFRGKFLDLLRNAFHTGKLHGLCDADAFETLLDSAAATDWVVYAKLPFGKLRAGPSAARHGCSSTSPATPTASPSPTAGSRPWTSKRSASGTRTTPTAAGRGS
jgi:hypothetical protein